MATYVIEIDEKTTAGKKVLSQLKSLNIKIRKETDLTPLQEKEAFLHTSKINAAKIFDKHL